MYSYLWPRFVSPRRPPNFSNFVRGIVKWRIIKFLLVYQFSKYLNWLLECMKRNPTFICRPNIQHFCFFKGKVAEKNIRWEMNKAGVEEEDSPRGPIPSVLVTCQGETLPLDSRTYANHNQLCWTPQHENWFVYYEKAKPAFPIVCKECWFSEI